MTTRTTRADAALLPVAALGALVQALQQRGYRVIGPTVRGEAIVLDEVGSADELPHGWGVRLDAGSYRLYRRSDGAVFAHAAGPQSWKPFLHPPRERLWSARRDGDTFTIDADPNAAGPNAAGPNAADPVNADPIEAGEAGDDRAVGAPPRSAFLGVRPCDLRAIAIQDRVLTGGHHTDTRYAARRAGLFIVAAQCTEPGGTCFCTSMGAGPAAGPGYDLALTELIDDDGHRFLVDVGSEAGAAVLAELPHRPADEASTEQARGAVADAADRMGRAMPEIDIRALLAGSHDAKQWDDVASRCLTCGNCTMVCPTCFCTTVEDVTDLTGEHAERWQRWESCFDLDFSYLHGGSVRSSARSRYRQWLTHKLGTWHDQFGSSGCVGCGRCIVWCPVGIDITAEVAALHAEATS